MNEAIGRRRAEILHEALPYIQRFWGKTIVVKLGGHAMTDPDALASFARDVVLLKLVGMNPVVVHGGGPQIGDLLERLEIPSRFVDGLRVTDAETMRVVEMVLVGRVNKEIVNEIQRAGGRCVGLSGKDGSLITARRLELPDEDVGMVGEIEWVDPTAIRALEQAGFIVVIAPVARSATGETLNINADLAAGRIAGALGAEKLILLTDVPGVRLGDRWMQTLDVEAITTGIERGEITGGMIPKLLCAREALEEGVGAVHILDGRQPNAVLLELFTDDGVGTMVRRTGGVQPRDRATEAPGT